jgi:hypothetical protein
MVRFKERFDSSPASGARLLDCCCWSSCHASGLARILRLVPPDALVDAPDVQVFGKIYRNQAIFNSYTSLNLPFFKTVTHPFKLILIHRRGQ